MEATGPNAENLYATLKNIVTNLDLDGSGKIDLEEFQPVYSRLNPLGTQADGRDKFALIDADNDGAISVVELAEHYGFRFVSGGDVSGDVDTTGMTDNQLIELMHLNSIASDSAMKRKQVRRTVARVASFALRLHRRADESHVGRAPCEPCVKFVHLPKRKSNRVFLPMLCARAGHGCRGSRGQAPRGADQDRSGS